MAVYTVHEPRLRGASAPEPERFVFVRDGFYFWASLVGPLWMLRHRMWLVLLGYGLLVAGLGWWLRHAQASAAIALSVNALLGLLIGFEAGTLRRFTLARRGFANIGIVVGDDIDLAERRFFDAWIRKSAPGGPAPRGDAAAPASTMRMPQAPSDVLGLFPEPGASA
ncbi:MAG TPA: DUF2628 domain-containing protein [Xanthobacteraceae bacterium]